MIYSYLTYYLLVGVVFNFLYDLMVDYLQRNGHEGNIRFNMVERVIVCLLWPIYLLLFIRNLYKEASKKNKDD